MKNLRKVLALVLAVVMTVTTFTVAFAAETEKTSGEVLKALGLVVGNENGDLMEDATITRAEAAQIIVKVMNWDLESADSYTFEDTTWAKAQAATLVKKGITSGVGNNNFGGANKMDALQVYAWVYAAITGDSASAWANPSLLTAILSADEVAAVQAAKGTDAKRSEIFKGMVTILTTEVEGTTQLDKLIEAGVVTEDLAVSLGLKEATVSENVILSVELLNYKEVKVVFSVEASTSTSAYKFGGKDVTHVTRSEDKKEAIVVLADKLEQQKKVTFNYESGSYKFEKKDLSIVDATMPTVVDVKTTDKGQLTITFSEAISKLPTVKIKDGHVYNSVDWAKKTIKVDKVDTVVVSDYRTIIVTVPSISEGTYKVEINGAEDFAGFKMAPKTIESYEYVKVTAPITVAVKEATSKQVELELSAPVGKKDLPAANFTYILGKEVKTAKVDGKTVTLNLENYPAPEGTWTLTIKKADEMFEDSWGNKASKEDITLQFTVAIDKVAPTVEIKEVKQADGKLVLKFNEAVATSAATHANYEIQGADGKKIDNAFVGTNGSYSDDKKEYTLDINKDAFKTENVTLVIFKDKIEDLSGNKIKDEVKLTFSTKFMKLLSAEVKVVEINAKDVPVGYTQKIYVNYKNNMLTSTLDLAKWAIVTTDIHGDDKVETAIDKKISAEIDSIKFDETSDIVIITLKKPAKFATMDITTTALEDVDSNKLEGAVLSFSWNSAEIKTIGTKTTMTGTATTAKTADIVIAGKVVGGINADAFKVNGTSATAVSAVQNVVYKDGKTTITVELNADNKLNANAMLVKGGIALELSVEGLELNSGVTLDAHPVKLADKITPAVTTADMEASVANKTATLALTEVIAKGVLLGSMTLEQVEALLATELVVKYAGITLVAGNHYTVDVNGSNLVVKFTAVLDAYLAILKTPIAADQTVSVSMAKASSYAQDGKLNFLQAFEKEAKFK